MKNYFYLNLRYYRILKHLSQKELAYKANLSQQYISLIEANNRSESPTLSTIVKLCNALDICPYELLQYNCANNCKKHNHCKKEDAIINRNKNY